MKFVIDSNVFISSIDPKDIFHLECYPILERLLNFEIEAVCPVLVLVETVCSIRRRTNNEALAISVLRSLVKLPSITWLDITLDVAELASIIGSKTGLRGGDAIVLQVAEKFEIPLVTKDKEIKSKASKGISVVEPAELIL